MRESLSFHNQMNTKTLFSKLVCIGIALQLFARNSPAAEPLTLGEPIVVPDSKGGFDYLQVDVEARRLLADHTANGTLDVVDLDSGKLIKHIPTGRAQGVAMDVAGGKYFVSVSKPNVLAIIDRKSLEKTGEVKLDGPADALVFDPKNHCVYVGHDNKSDLWVVDTKTEKVVTSIKIPDGPEYVIYDSVGDRIFQNVKSTDVLLVIDPTSNTIKESWPTAPAKSPHGLAFNPETKRLFCAGGNGIMSVIDSQTGKVVGSAEIAKSVDQIAFDKEKRRIYCASRLGVVSVLEETTGGAQSLGDVKTAPGAKTITFDPKTHAVWIAYADKDHSYVRKLTPN